MIILPQSIVSLVEAMYQSAFVSLEFRLNKIQVQLSFKFYTGNKERK